ncbi:hypothetical protein OG936_35795 [Streptomyces sp. NBC_00846]|nr:hypothetical protein OG936_35795 [Streptomyces sp. NBC_00846]
MTTSRVDHPVVGSGTGIDAAGTWCVLAVPRSTMCPRWCGCGG